MSPRALTCGICRKPISSTDSVALLVTEDRVMVHVECLTQDLRDRTEHRAAV